MKIKKMTASFGALSGKTLDLGDGLNILYAPNESGKSTWCAFLRTMLYGLNTAQRAKAGQQPDKVKYRPWSGASMSGSMELETEGREVTVRRWTEKASQPMQAFSATVTGTEMPVSGVTSDNAGEIFAGVPREVFERSAFIRQSGLAVSADPELEKRINSIVSTGDEEVSYTETNDRLKKWRNRRSGRKGALQELEAEMEKITRQMEVLHRAAEEREAMDGAVRAAEERLGQAVQIMEQARREARENARQAMMANMSASRRESSLAEEKFREAKAALEHAKEALNETPFKDMGPEEARRRSDIDLSNARELEKLAAKLPPLKIAFIPLIVAAAAFLLALVLPWQMECIGVGCVGVILFAVMYLRLSSMQKTKADTLADRQRILDAYGVENPDEIGGLLENYRTLWQNAERARFRFEQAEEEYGAAQERRKAAEERIVDGLDFQQGDNAAARAGKAVEEAKNRLAEQKERRAAMEGRLHALGDPMVLQSELSELRARHENISRQDEALALAMEVLANADEELQKRFSPGLARETAAIFGRLTDGRYDEITLARDLTAKARCAGDAVGWDMDYLSAGAKDQLYLALRLAVCRLALPQDDPCPIVLDDALVTFDRERMERALELLAELSRERQVLLFTCHERELEYFADDDRAVKITLEI